MKDDCEGCPIAKFVSLCPKLYSICETSDQSSKEAKGMGKDIVREHIWHEQYKEALLENRSSPMA